MQLAKLLRREDPGYGSVTFDKKRYWTPAIAYRNILYRVLS